uniref:(northern house mosquito) hypothetical protein n=1 Tax=Culex pipiens TaxID=7175 RepID=A0A8D8NHI9_CULPI
MATGRCRPGWRRLATILGLLPLQLLGQLLLLLLLLERSQVRVAGGRDRRGAGLVRSCLGRVLDLLDGEELGPLLAGDNLLLGDPPLRRGLLQRNQRDRQGGVRGQRRFHHRRDVVRTL